VYSSFFNSFFSYICEEVRCYKAKELGNRCLFLFTGWVEFNKDKGLIYSFFVVCIPLNLDACLGLGSLNNSVFYVYFYFQELYLSCV